MADPTILYDATNGSDTAASGAGPATAVTGSAAAHTSGASSTTITLTNSPDLSGVATDGSAALWLNVGADSRHFSKITAADDGADTVTVEDSFNIAAVSAVNYAIGGERKTLENRSSWPDWKDQKHGWTFEFDAGTYDITTEVGVIHSGTSTGGRWRWVAKSGAASRPFIRATADVKLFRPSSNNAYVTIQGLKFGTNVATPSNTYVEIDWYGSYIFDDCVLDVGGAAYAFYLDFVRVTVVLKGCYVTGASTVGLRMSGARDDNSMNILGCVFDGGGGSYFSDAAVYIAGDETTSVVRDCLIYDAVGKGMWVVTDQASFAHITGNTIVDNGGDGIYVQPTTLVGPLVMAMNNVIAFNGGYGFQMSVYSSLQAPPEICDYNAFYSNTSGARNGPTAGAHDVTLTADPFTSRATDDYSLNSAAGGGALIDDEGFPTSLPDGT